MWRWLDAIAHRSSTELARCVADSHAQQATPTMTQLLVKIVSSLPEQIVSITTDVVHRMSSRISRVLHSFEPKTQALQRLIIYIRLDGWILQMQLNGKRDSLQFGKHRRHETNRRKKVSRLRPRPQREILGDHTVGTDLHCPLNNLSSHFPFCMKKTVLRKIPTPNLSKTDATHIHQVSIITRLPSISESNSAQILRLEVHPHEPCCLAGIDREQRSEPLPDRLRPSDFLPRRPRRIPEIRVRDHEPGTKLEASQVRSIGSIPCNRSSLMIFSATRS